MTILLCRYWLPSILKHEIIALRFLPQHFYEQATPLDIKPQPAVVARTFMLFQGVKVDELCSKWASAVDRRVESEATGFWKHVVGVDTDKVKDSTLLRVIEWGGMEVYA